MSTLSEDFIKLVQEECGGMRLHLYHDQLTSGLRVGQAFMNALRGTSYYEQLTGTRLDPFYSENFQDVHKAIDFLTTK